ncbi:MAG: VWA domain-containing protein [Chthoniobacteraceae bacterium]
MSLDFFNADAFSFAQPWWLLALLLIPLAAWMQGGLGPSPAIRFSFVAPLRGFASPRRAGAGGFRSFIICAALACLVIALARPRLGKTRDTIESSGVDIILELDVSGSMLSEDFKLGNDRASRIEVVKDVTKRFIEGRPNDRIGIIAFAGRPYLVSPLTLDHDWLLKNLERLRIGLVEDGTSIGSALASAANRLKDRKSKSKIIVLLTDGDENITTVPPATAAEAAKTLGIRIYTIAAGTNGTAPYPVGRDFFGNKVYRDVPVSVEEGELRKVAEIGGGKFFIAMDTNAMNNIFAEIDKLEKTEVKLQRKTDWKDLFEWFIGAGAALAVLHALLSQTRWRTLP